MSEVFRFQTDGTNCGFCNWSTRSHYLIAKSREEAEELFNEGADDRDPRGFCAQCLLDEIIMGEDLQIVAPEEE